MFLLQVEVKAEITSVRPTRSQSYITTDSWSASLSWCQATILDTRSIILLSLIISRQLRIHWFGGPPLTWGRVCSSQVLLGISRASFFRCEFHGTREHILLSSFPRLPQTGWSISCIIFSVYCIEFGNQETNLRIQVKLRKEYLGDDLKQWSKFSGTSKKKEGKSRKTNGNEVNFWKKVATM
jgi:hypothetical protein